MDSPSTISRNAVNAKAARLLSQFIYALGLSVRDFAQLAYGDYRKESSVRYFLANASSNPNARRHTRGPYATTLRPILNLQLPQELSDALLDVIDYTDRVLLPKLRVQRAQIDCEAIRNNKIKLSSTAEGNLQGS
jgi:hypothetical protein